MDGRILVPLEERARADTDYNLLHKVDATFRHTLVMLAHLGMYFVGGAELLSAFQNRGFCVPRMHCVAIALLSFVPCAIDLTRVCRRFFGYGFTIDTWYAFSYYLRRLGIIVARLPSAISLVMMMSIPTRLCQDLIQTAMAIDDSDVQEAQRRYCLFWHHLNTGRTWYNAVMACHFLVAVGRIPIGVYILVNIQLKNPSWEQVFLFVFTACDALQMMIWLQPAIAIRINHGVLLRAVVSSAARQTESTTTLLATMMASLHPIAGLKLIGFLVTTSLVPQVATLASVIWTCLRLLVKGNVE